MTFSNNSKMFLHPKYRADIDGLRAIAVLSVVGFHAFPNLVRGGFIGVDVFFVISGYLISSIIMGNLEHQQFSFQDFYARRIRRIFPALIIVLSSSIVLGWFVLLPDEFEQLAKHTAAGSAFISNFVLWSESGYFDTLAISKPLLHLWSLGIEEQFYILWPVLLGLVWRRGWNFLIITLAIAFGSFLLNLYLSTINPIADFYSPFSRFWELMIGGVLAYVSMHHPSVLRKYQNWQALSGFLLLSVGLIILNESSVFPGWWALLPTLGAFLLISAGSESWLNSHFLGSKPLVWVGLISYPLYLWHWPILSFAYIIEGGNPSKLIRSIAVLASIMAAYLTYRLIEKSFRNGLKLKIKNLLLVSMSIILLILGLYIYQGKGLPERPIMAKNDISDIAKTKEKPPIFPSGIMNCMDDAAISKNVRPYCQKYIVNPSGKTMVVWGDSSSRAWAYVFYKLAEEHKVNVYIISHYSCPPLLGIGKTSFQSPESRKYCSDGTLGSEVLASLKVLNPRIVFLIGAWNGYTYYPEESSKLNEYITTNLSVNANKESSIAAMKQKLPETIEALDSFTNVVVFRSWPKLLERPSPYHRLKRLDFIELPPPIPLKSARQHLQESALVNEILDGIIKSGHTKQTRIFDPSTLVCSTFCNLSVSNIDMYHADDYHITPNGSFMFKPALTQLLGPLAD